MKDQMGETITTGAIENEEFVNNYTATVQSDWNADNLSVAVVLWEKNSNGTYSIVNGNVTKM